MNDLRHKIKDHKDYSFSQEKREDLLHDFNQAQDSRPILKWKAHDHVLRSVNKEKAKQQP
jgi:hypothetical protein